MIFTLNILINLCLIFICYKLNKRKRHSSIHFIYKEDKKTKGLVDKMYIRSVIAEKMADRAFNMASSSNLGVIALQKALVIPRLMTRAQTKQNALAKASVDKLFTQNGEFDYLKPVLSDEDLELLETIEKDKLKEN